MLQNIEANHRIKELPQRFEVAWIRQVALSNLHIGPELQPRLQAADMLVIDIRRKISGSAFRQLNAEVAYAGAQLENRSAEIWPDRIRHPPVESRGVGEHVKNLRSSFAVNVSPQAVLQHYRDRLEGVFQPDLFAFVVRSSVVADRCLEDSCAALREFNR